MYAVVKADAYGCGAARVARVLADIADGYYLFDLAEVHAAGLFELGKRTIVLDQPWQGYTPGDYREAGATPIVSSLARASEMVAGGVRPVLSIDTGMHRFGCEAGDIAPTLALGIDEVMTHAARSEQVQRLLELTAGRERLFRHAAGTALLADPDAWLDAVRPGLALYRGAVRATARVVEARDVRPDPHGTLRAGYGGFEAARVGVILAGYTSGLRPGTCLIKGQARRVCEVGMQSAYVELAPGEGVGEEVVLLGGSPAGPTLGEVEVAAKWGVSPQEVLVRFGRHRLTTEPLRVEPAR